MMPRTLLFAAAAYMLVLRVLAADMPYTGQQARWPRLYASRPGSTKGHPKTSAINAEGSLGVGSTTHSRPLEAAHFSAPFRVAGMPTVK